jgi:hypothetical protein
MGFRPSHLALGPQDIQRRRGLVSRAAAQERRCHRGQLAFGAPARFAPARARLTSYIIGLLLGGLVDVPEDGQQRVKLGLG